MHYTFGLYFVCSFTMVLSWIRLREIMSNKYLFKTKLRVCNESSLLRVSKVSSAVRVVELCSYFVVHDINA